MTTVAVTGAGGFTAAALLERLDADRVIERIIGVDCVEPQMPVAKLDFRVTDVCDPLLALALEGADVIVHLAFTSGPVVSEDTMFEINVEGTRNLLAAADAVGASRLVHLSSAVVYGASVGNVVPLREDLPLRANPDFRWAFHHLLAEELVTRWAAEHAGTTVTVLRPVTTLGPGADTAVSRHLEQPWLPVVRGYLPPVQLLHVDDLAAALHLAVVRDLPGAYNVAAEGWLPLDDMARVMGRGLLRVPESVAFPAAWKLWRHGAIAAPPGALHYLMHPWVVSTERLHAQGWAPTRSNRDILREFVADHHPWMSLGRLRVRRRHCHTAAGVLVTAAAGGMLALRRRVGRRVGGA
ncbi:MAG: NAD-dependent epimerase/dehydratase family protein [Actinomycetota bacterium]|nr:NAD-dependent epimerase/dehydratase family protein [Actinomycetota bacterium]